RILEVTTSANNDDLVLDFFAGSATVADAVLQQNALDNGNRRFIMVQLDEILKRETEFKTVADVARMRIVKACGKIQENTSVESVDTGFRALSVDSTNMADVLRKPDQVDQLTLDELRTSINPGRSSEDRPGLILVLSSSSVN